MKKSHSFGLYHLQNLTHSSKTAQNRALCHTSFERAMIGLTCVKKSSGVLWCAWHSRKFKYKDCEKKHVNIDQNYFSLDDKKYQHLTTYSHNMNPLRPFINNSQLGMMRRNPS